MEMMTSAFPSTARPYSHNPALLDKIIFYSGPVKTRETSSTAADELPDIDMTLAETAQQEWAAVDGTERLDPAGGFDITGEGELYSQRSRSGLPFNARGFRHLECNRYKLGSVGGHLDRSAFRGR
jgi:hypothetical protein